MLSAGQHRHTWAALLLTGQTEASLACCRELVARSCGSLMAWSNTAGPSASAEIHSAIDALAGPSSSATPPSQPAWCNVDRPDEPPEGSSCSTSSRGSQTFSGSGLLSSPRGRGSWRQQAVGLHAASPLPWAPAFAGLSLVSPPLGSRAYHPWFYGSKLRNRTIAAAGSLEELGALLRREGEHFDHVNLAVFLRVLERAAADAAARAAAEVAASPAAAAAGGAAAGGGSAVSGAVAAAAARAVEERVAALAAEAGELVRRRAKWYDPRYAAAVVARTASLGFTDGRMLRKLTYRVLARLNEAYSRDLLLLLRGLYTHAQRSAGPAAAAAAAVVPAAPAAADASSAVAETGRRRRRGPAPPLPYGGPPAALAEGVAAFLAAKLPTGRMPPENVDGLLRYLRALTRAPIGPALCAAAEQDLAHRMPIYAPGPLAGVLATLAAERHPLPPPLLAAAADQFAATAAAYGNGAAAGRFLAAAAALLRADAADATAAAAAAGAAAPAEWIAARPELLSACLELMARDAPSAPVGRLAHWMQALAAIQAPLASPTAAVSSFTSAQTRALEAALPALPAASPVRQRLRAAYDSLALPYPRGL